MYDVHLFTPAGPTIGASLFLMFSQGRGGYAQLILGDAKQTRYQLIAGTLKQPVTLPSSDAIEGPAVPKAFDAMLKDFRARGPQYTYAQLLGYPQRSPDWLSAKLKVGTGDLNMADIVQGCQGCIESWEAHAAARPLPRMDF